MVDVDEQQAHRLFVTKSPLEFFGKACIERRTVWQSGQQVDIGEPLQFIG